MTLPSEEVRALQMTRDLLRLLCSSNLTTIRRDAKDIKETARACLKHYPWDMTIDDLWEQRIKDKEPWRNDTKSTEDLCQKLKEIEEDFWRRGCGCPACQAHMPPLTDEQKAEIDKRIADIKRWEEEGTLDQHCVTHDEVMERVKEKHLKMIQELEEHQKRPPNHDMKFGDPDCDKCTHEVGSVECHDAPKCPKHPHIKLVDGKCLVSTLNYGMPDFIGDPKGMKGCTMSPGGPGKMVDCWKCPECGLSITKDNKIYVEKVDGK